MCAQFGILNFDGRPVASDLFEKAKPMLTPYGPDGCTSLMQDSLGLLYCALHSTEESTHETQPHVAPSGAVITWDGRLDNRSDLLSELNCDPLPEKTDVSIVATAYERWGKDCLARLVGDWALSIWDQRDRTLLLAKDFVGVRHLYYSFTNKDQITWSTILDPLLLLAGHAFKLDEEYIAGLLISYPASHLTPYIGIQSVPPSSFVAIRSSCRKVVTRYWNFDPNRRVRYKTDEEYEEHFRTVFADAVRRRLRSHTPVLSELSGGMDSCSIVCMADQIVATTGPETNLQRLDTVSRYTDLEPNWDERPYFTKVEEKRGRTGYHIYIGSEHQGSDSPPEGSAFRVTPGSVGSPSLSTQRFAEFVKSQGYRVLLSGIGGDEAMGGLPNPFPELADLLTSIDLAALAHRLKEWGMARRNPLMHLLIETIRNFIPATPWEHPAQLQKVKWLRRQFVRRQRRAFLRKDRHFSLFGPRPSFQANLNTLMAMQDEMAYREPDKFLGLEKRYPYLDRDLLVFLYAIPREQLLRPGQRRSLMRRALKGIVPREILERKRKAFVVRGPMTYLAEDWASISALAQQMALSSLGIIDSAKFLEDLQKARAGEEVALIVLMRVLAFERWVMDMRKRNLLQVAVTPYPAGAYANPGIRTRAKA